MRRTALALMPLARAIRSAVQWVVSTGGSASVSATTRAATSGPSGGMREGRVLSCRRPAMPSFMNRSCQRQTQVFDLPVRRMISLVPTPSALERMIAARQACFCEALRSLVIASSRPRTDRVIVMEIPVRMHQTRTATETGESQSGLFCQAETTSGAERRPSPRSSSQRPGAGPTEECLGSVKWFNVEKGFGFVAADRGGKDVFVHATTLDQSGLSELPEGQRVRMQIVQGQKGPEARSIELLD